MSRRRKVPSYRHHKQSNQAIVTLPDGLGGRHDILLGEYGSPQSWAEYARVITEWEMNGRRWLPSRPTTDLTVNELVAACWAHVEQHYRRPDGTPTNEQSDYKLSVRPLVFLYGHTLAKDFGPLSLKAVRQLMIDGYQHPKHGPQAALARGVVNQRIGRIRRMFRWAVENEMVPPTVYHGLMAVRGLQRGRSQARETEPVKPVPDAVVEASLPYLRPTVAAMVQVQRHTGMRPGELVIMRGVDLDMTGKVWLYRPGSDRGPAGEHKTAWRGHAKVIAIGPQAQEIIRQYLKPNVYAYLFSPADTVEAMHRERRSGRKTKAQPSQARRTREVRPERKPHDRYTTASYGRSIARGVELANKALACEPCKKLAPEARCPKCQASAIPHWHPHQLRHTKATEIRKNYGLDMARAVLGHRSPSVTEVYAEIDLGKAAEVMERIG